jgi:cysteine-rich repeat protein
VTPVPPIGGAARRPPRPRPRFGAAVALLCLALPIPALGHGTPIELAIWGDFPPAIARCQRVIGRAAAVCGLRVWRARRDCALAPLRDSVCDEDAADRAAEQARIAALDDVSRHCTAMQVTNLQFIDVREAQADVIRFCRELEAATTSLLLAPLATAPAPQAAACGAAAARTATRLLGDAFRARQHLLDRIAAVALPGRTKLTMVADSDGDIATAAGRLGADLDATCPAGLFGDLYQSDVDTVLGLVASRADCLAGDAYAQGEVLCPLPACGNRMREGLEECDDGNVAEGDGCSADCRRTVTSGSRS